MAIELSVNGLFEVDIYDLENKILSCKDQKKVLDKLNSGDYLLFLAEGKISSVTDYTKTLYKVKFSVSSAEYEFDEL